MTTNPLFTGEVQTSDGREAHVLHHRCTECRIVADVLYSDGWHAVSFDLKGTSGAGDGHSIRLIPKPQIPEELRGERTWALFLCPDHEMRDDTRLVGPHALITITDGDEASAVVKVVKPGEG